MGSLHVNLYVLAVAASCLVGALTGLFTWAIQKTWGKS